MVTSAVTVPIYGKLSDVYGRRLPAGAAGAARELAGAAGAVDPQSLINARTQAALEARFAALGPQGLELYREFIEAVRGALAAGMHELFTLGLVFAAATLLGTFLLREIRLKRDEYYATNEPTGQDGYEEASPARLQPGGVEGD